MDKSFCCRFLNEVQSFSSTNKMSIQNLATVFGPNILRPKAEDPESIIGGKTLKKKREEEPGELDKAHLGPTFCFLRRFKYYGLIIVLKSVHHG